RRREAQWELTTILLLPGAGSCEGFRVRKPAPRMDPSFPGKPRNPDESLDAHDGHLAERPPSGRYRVARHAGPRGHIIAKATNISPNMPTAMIILVVVSIVASVSQAQDA